MIRTSAPRRRVAHAHRLLVEEAPPRPQTLTGYTPLRLAVGCLLWTAALAKAWQVSTEPFAFQWWWRLVLVEFELVLGLLLLSGLWRRAVWWVTTGVFCLFAGVAGYQIYRGAASCGCFGQLTVPPEITLAVDLTILLLLLVSRPSPSPADEKRKQPTTARKTILSGVALAVGLVALGLMAARRPGTIDVDGQIVGDSSVVFLKPDTWAGRRFPLSAHIERGQELLRGRWAVLLYHADCARCQELVENWPAAWGVVNGDARRAIVVVPPAGNATAELRQLEPRPWVSQLSRLRDWLVATPTFVYLKDGLVTGTSRGGRDGPSIDETPDQDVSPSTAVADDGQKPAPVEKIQNLGYIRPGSHHKLHFDVQNPHQENLSIDDVLIECDCMRLIDPPSGIAAGQTARVEVEFDAGKKPLVYRKRIVLHTDHSALGHIILTVTARIGLPLRVEPEVLLWQRGAGPQEHKTTVYNDGDRTVKLLYCTSDTPGCVMRVPAQPVPAGGNLELTIDLKPDALTEDRRVAKLRLVTGSRVQRELALTVRHKE